MKHLWQWRKVRRQSWPLSQNGAMVRKETLMLGILWLKLHVLKHWLPSFQYYNKKSYKTEQVWYLTPFITKLIFSRGVAGEGGVLGCPWPPLLGRPSFEQTTYNIQVAKTPWQYLGRKSHCWKAHFFKICFFVKYFRQRLLSLVNMGIHAAIIQLSPLIHKGEQRYKPWRSTWQSGE